MEISMAKLIALIKALGGGGGVDPAVIEEAVNDWLDDHPEATTTVQDGAITKEKLDSNLQGTVDDVGDLKSAIDDIFDLMPTSEAHDWEAYTYTTTSGYISRTGVQGTSQYSDFVEIAFSAGTQYKISGRCPNNTTIAPIVYKDDNGVLGTEPSTGDTTLTNYVLTVPDGTKKIYINWTPKGTSGVDNVIYSKAATVYAKAAAETAVEGKLGAPSVSGTNGQVLTSDGSGGTEWSNFPIDNTLTQSGKAADAKVTGDAIDNVISKLPIIFSSVTLTTVSNAYMQLSMAERSLNGYRYTYVEFESGAQYKVTTKASCNTALAPVIYADSNGDYAGQYPTEASSSDVLLEGELLSIPNAAVGMYVNCLGSATLAVEKGIVSKAEAATDYTRYTWNAVGDSITYNGRYMAEVSSIIGLPYENKGVSGSTLAINDTYMEGESIVERVCGLNGQTAMSDADVWTVMGGLNDCLYDSPLGQLNTAGSTFDKTTVYGALQAICEYVLNLRAHPRLILMTPTQSVRDAWSAETHPTTMALIRKAVIDVGEYYSVTVFDTWAKSGISAYNIQKATDPTTSDGVHLNVLGADILGEKLALCIKDELFGIEDD